jgi:hypothetical protein
MINQQQPNQDIKQNTNGNNPSQNNGGGKPPTPEQRAGEFNRACGEIQMSKDTCNKVIAAKNGAEAIAALGPDSEKFCKALAKMACKDVMPFAFP